MKVRVVFESEKPIDIPTRELREEEAPSPRKDRLPVLLKDGQEFKGRTPKKSIAAQFNIPFEGKILGLSHKSEVLLQFIGGPRRQSVIATGNCADFYEVYKFLTSFFDMKFRLAKLDFLDHTLREKYERWRWNLDILVMQFKHNPEKTLSFITANLPELVTAMSLRRIPRQFNEKFEFIRLDNAEDEMDFFY